MWSFVFTFLLIFCVWSVILHSAALSSRDKYVSFFTSASQRKNDCKHNFRVFTAVFIRFTKLSVDRKTRYFHVLYFWDFESLKVLQRKGRKNHSLWDPVPQSCSFLFMFVHLLMKTNLIEKTRSTNIDYCSFMVLLWLLKLLYFITFLWLFLIL